MAELNTLSLVCVGTRNGQEYSVVVEASPILLSASEITPGNPSIIRTEYQDFAIQVSQLSHLYPPEPGDVYRNQQTREEYQPTSMGSDEPCYQHVTSERERVIVHTVRTKR